MRARLPKFKSRKRDRARFRIPQRVKLDEGQVFVPKIGFVRIHQSQPISEPTRSATCRRSPDGKWYISLTVEFDLPDMALPAPDPTKAVGIDVGLIGYATFSDDTPPVPALKFFRQRERKLRRAQRKVSRCRKGSKRRSKAARKVAVIHAKTSSKRSDFQHKLSTKIVRSHEAVFTEDLSLKGLARTKLAKSFADAGLGEFQRQLQYKCLWDRRHFLMVDRYFPSSKLCNRCGVIKDSLTLSDRAWDCTCGARHQRDFLAACNIRDEGLRMLAAGQTDSLNAHGAGVRPAKRGQSASN
jgi:putative transposase